MQALPPEILVNILDRFDVDTEKPSKDLLDFGQPCSAFSFPKGTPYFIYYHLTIWPQFGF